MDKLDSTLRELLSTRTELLGAIRLPNDAFKKNAGTEVTTDIVMLRRLHPGETPTGPAWRETASHANDGGEEFTINEFFTSRPEMMLGQMRLTGGMYGGNEPTLEPEPVTEPPPPPEDDIMSDDAVEAIADAGAKDGLDAEMARELVVETTAGTAELLRRRHPADVRKAVAAPGGSTEAGLEALDREGVREAFEAAVRASLERMRG